MVIGSRLVIAVRLLHTAIYAVMVASILYILYAGFGGLFIPWVLDVTLVLVTGECIVFVGSGWKCPLTKVAVALAGRDGKDYAPIIPAKLARYTPVLFGSLFALGLVTLLWRLFVRKL